MEIAAFCRRTKVLIVAGKGGVGKTTVAATISNMAAVAGLDVLLVDLEGKSGLVAAFGEADELDYDERHLEVVTPDQATAKATDQATQEAPDRKAFGSLAARRITADDALEEYLSTHGMRRAAKRLVSSGALDVVATAVPGLRDILLLGRIKQLERDEVADLIVVDAPATGHLMTFLSSARGLVDAARSGPVRTQAADVLELLNDSSRCQVMLVTQPEEMPVNEAAEAATALKTTTSIALAPIVVNGCLPDAAGLDLDVPEALSLSGVALSDAQKESLTAAADFTVHRYRTQLTEIQHLSDLLGLAQLHLPDIAGGTIGPPQLGALTRVLMEQVAHLDGALPDIAGPPAGGEQSENWVPGTSGKPPEVSGASETSGEALTASGFSEAPRFPKAKVHADGPTLAALVQDKSVVVCCGSGGVGKTTVSAALAVQAARLGRTVCVVTIDPARRLADALGLDELGNHPSIVEGDWPGVLYALMLDPKGTFDDLVRRQAANPEQADAIMGNRLYRNLTGALSGTQEYMAMEKLYELTQQPEIDLVIVDTPPSRNAMDFLEAPGRLTRFLGHRLFQLALMPTRAYMKAVSVATHALLRAISKVAGTEIVEEAIAFFAAFEGMEEGFRMRAAHMTELLVRPSTAFVMVSSARAEAVEESMWFVSQLQAASHPIEALVVNRMTPDFGDLGDLGGADEMPPALPGPPLRGSASPKYLSAAPFKTLRDNAVELSRSRQREESLLAPLVKLAGVATVVKVPLLQGDIHDVEGLGAMADSMSAGSAV